MVTFRCPGSTTTVTSTPDTATPVPTSSSFRDPSSAATSSSTPEDATPASRDVVKGLSMQLFRANLLEYLKATKATGRRAITWHEEDEPGPHFDTTPDPKYPGGKLFLTRAFYDGYRPLLKKGSPWPTVQEILEAFDVSREEMTIM